MAEVLSIVAEHGVHGMEYNGLLGSWCSEDSKRQSKRARISILPAPVFSGDEFEDYLILAWRFGLVERSKYREVDWKHGLNKSTYPIDDEIVRLTERGWSFLDELKQTRLERWIENIWTNVPAIIVAVLIAWP